MSLLAILAIVLGPSIIVLCAATLLAAFRVGRDHAAASSRRAGTTTPRDRPRLAAWEQPQASAQKVRPPDLRGRG